VSHYGSVLIKILLNAAVIRLKYIFRREFDNKKGFFAVGQLGPVNWDKDETAERILALAKLAKDKGAQFLGFPEIALTPFSK